MKSTSLPTAAAVVTCAFAAVVVVAQPSAEARPPSAAPAKATAPTSLFKIPAAPPNAAAVIGAKHLAVQEKIKLVLHTGPTQSSDVQAPFTLGPRTPVDAANGSAAFVAPAFVNSAYDTSYMKPDSRLDLEVHGRANYRYLIDCIAVSDAPVEMTAIDSTGRAAHGTSSVSSSNPHATLVIPKRTANADFGVEVQAHTYWSLGQCEITPIR